MPLIRQLSNFAASIVLLAGVAMFSGCGDDDPAGPNNNTPTDHVTFTLDGTQHVFTLGAQAQTATGGIVAVGALSTNAGEVILMAVPDTKRTEPFENNNGITMNLSIGGLSYTSLGQTGTGSVTISDVSATRITGTFFGTIVLGSDTSVQRSVTDGSFSVPFVTP